MMSRKSYRKGKKDHVHLQNVAQCFVSSDTQPLHLLDVDGSVSTSQGFSSSKLFRKFHNFHLRSLCESSSGTKLAGSLAGGNCSTSSELSILYMTSYNVEYIHCFRFTSFTKQRRRNPR